MKRNDNDPKCGKCGLAVTTGMMAALCPQARECEFWPHATKPEEEGAELLMAKFWMDNACEQIGLQIDDRKRLRAALERVRAWDMVHEPAPSCAEPCHDAPRIRELIDEVLRTE